MSTAEEQASLARDAVAAPGRLSGRSTHGHVKPSDVKPGEVKVSMGGMGGSGMPHDRLKAEDAEGSRSRGLVPLSGHLLSGHLPPAAPASRRGSRIRPNSATSAQRPGSAARNALDKGGDGAVMRTVPMGGVSTLPIGGAEGPRCGTPGSRLATRPLSNRRLSGSLIERCSSPVAASFTVQTVGASLSRVASSSPRDRPTPSAKEHAQEHTHTNVHHVHMLHASDSDDDDLDGQTEDPGDGGGGGEGERGAGNGDKEKVGGGDKGGGGKAADGGTLFVGAQMKRNDAFNGSDVLKNGAAVCLCACKCILQTDRHTHTHTHTHTHNTRLEHTIGLSVCVCVCITHTHTHKRHRARAHNLPVCVHIYYTHTHTHTHITQNSSTLSACVRVYISHTHTHTHTHNTGREHTDSLRTNQRR